MSEKAPCTRTPLPARAAWTPANAENTPEGEDAVQPAEEAAPAPEIADDNPETGTKVFTPVKDGDPMPQPTAPAEPQPEPQPEEEVPSPEMEEIFSASTRAPRAARVNIEAVNVEEVTEEDESMPVFSEESFEDPEEFFESLKEKLRDNIIEEPEEAEKPEQTEATEE